jgi:hypothetical protein
MNIEAKMISKIKYIFLLFFLSFWAIGYFPALHRIAEKEGIFPDDYRYGDLYRLSLLPQFKEEVFQCETTFIPEKISKTHLYIIGDSFTETTRVDTNRYAAEKVTYVHWEAFAKITLDSTEKNILLLETIERKYREHLIEPVRNFEVFDLEANSKILAKQKKHQSESAPKKGFYKEIINTIFPPKIDDRLERSTFSYGMFLKIKELKTRFNHYVLGKEDYKTPISEDKKNIFYFEEAQSTHPNSSFYPMPETQLDSLIKNTNEAKKHYLSKGFDKVILSIIPNKVSILDPEMGFYNHLIERVQTSPKLALEFIDCYQLFKKQKESMYLKSDSHWNCFGQKLWLNEINGKLNLD